jgi:hypothetical protein
MVPSRELRRGSRWFRDWVGVLASIVALALAAPSSAQLGEATAPLAPPEPPAPAAPPEPQRREQARGLANDAANAFARGEFALAHELCQRAHALVPAPTIALLDARSLVALQRFVEAADVYEKIESSRLEPGASEAFQRAVTAAAVERARLLPRIPQLKVELVDSPRARAAAIRLDGRAAPAGLIGSWVAVDPGHHTVVVWVSGKLESSESVTIAEGQQRIVHVRLKTAERKDPWRTAGYVGLGVGALSLLTAVVTGGIALDARADAERDCPERECAAGSSGESSLDRFRGYRTVSTVSYVFGGAAVGFGALAVFWPRAEPESKLSISASVQSVRLEGRW